MSVSLVEDYEVLRKCLVAQLAIVERHIEHLRSAEALNTKHTRSPRVPRARLLILIHEILAEQGPSDSATVQGLLEERHGIKFKEGHIRRIFMEEIRHNGQFVAVGPEQFDSAVRVQRVE